MFRNVEVRTREKIALLFFPSRNNVSSEIYSYNVKVLIEINLLIDSKHSVRFLVTLHVSSLKFTCYFRYMNETRAARMVQNGYRFEFFIDAERVCSRVCRNSAKIYESFDEGKLFCSIW